MREKLLELLKREGLKPSQLAEILEINPAGISHILAGRNKPSFELLQKILRHFPRINPDWLLLDSEQMYRQETNIRSDQVNPMVTQVATEHSPADRTIASSMNRMTGDLFAHPSGNEISGSIHNEVRSETGTGELSMDQIARTSGLQNKSGIQRIVIFYDDQTFVAYSPTKR